MKNLPIIISLFMLIAVGAAFISSEKAERYVPPSTSNVMGLALNTARQPTDQRSSIVSYNVTISCAATLVLGSAGQVNLDTSSTGTGGWGSVSQAQYSINSGLVVSGSATVTVFAAIPRAYYFRIRSTNVTGTPTYSTAQGTEILIN